MKESELAEKVVAWLEVQHWDVYQEVRMFGIGGNTIDIVAVRNGIYWCIECKASLSMTVLSQANDHCYAHRRSIAVPRAKRTNQGRPFAKQVAEKFNIGIIEVYGSDVDEILPAPLLRRNHEATKDLERHLHPEQKYYRKAGSTSGHTYTPYRVTMNEVKRIISKNPFGITLKEIFNKLEFHHYSGGDSAARQIIKKALVTWERDWCRVERTGKILRYYIRDAVPKGESDVS